MTRCRHNPPCQRREYWGRGGAGVLFTCSEDGTVLLLLRAAWVQQGGTWGIPGGGIGEGFYRTPMQPLTDMRVFREKAEEEVEEECGAFPPYMTHLPEGLPFTEYEDCGFRYVTFVLDITKKQKATWAPFSADGENDAFVWFPLDAVKKGRPLPDENGDLHDIHFGVTFTMGKLPTANPRRRNPEPPSTDVNSAAFKRWFGASKVVDAQGRPRVVYHGTAYAPGQPPITEFRGPHQPFRYPAFREGRGKFVGVGSFFSESEEVAASYPYASMPQTQNYTRVVHALYLRIEKPKAYRTLRAAMDDMVARAGPDPVAFVNMLRAEGYDGITFMEGPSYNPTDAKKKARVWITFSPEQVRHVHPPKAAPLPVVEDDEYDDWDDDLVGNPRRRNPEPTVEVYRDRRGEVSGVKVRLAGGEVSAVRPDPAEREMYVGWSGLPESERGKGQGIRMYAALMDWALENDFILTSDETVSREAGRVWEALARRGYPIRKHPEARTIAEGNIGAWYAHGRKPPFLLHRRNPRPTTAERTDPALWEAVKREVTAGSKGGVPGEWSARKAQLAVALYKKRGGDYIGPKSPQNALAKWTREDWRTRSGKPSLVTGERYLPARAIEALTPAEYAATSRAKRAGLLRDEQFTPQPERIAQKTARYRKNPEYVPLRWEDGDDEDDLDFEASGHLTDAVSAVLYGMELTGQGKPSASEVSSLWQREGVSPHARALYLHSISVSPSLRGAGEGRRYVSHIENDVRRRGVEVVVGHADHSLGFWQKQGYTLWPRPPAEHPELSALMYKVLAQANPARRAREAQPERIREKTARYRRNPDYKHALITTLREHGARLYTYDTLPAPAKAAAAEYLEDPKTSDYLVGELPTEYVKQRIVSEWSEPFAWPSFDAYHRWYVEKGEQEGRMPDYPLKGRWPSLLAGGDKEGFLWDGWHRFHAYVRSGHPTVPVYMLVSKKDAEALRRANPARKAGDKRYRRNPSSREAEAIRAIRANLTPDLLAGEYRACAASSPASYNPVAGQCAVATEALYFMLGGKAAGYTPMNVRHEGVSHWYLRTPDGRYLDPTADQFDTPVDYASGRGRGFPTPRQGHAEPPPSKRAAVLLSRIR